MWWKLALSAVGGFVLGIAVIAIPTYLFVTQTREMGA